MNKLFSLLLLFTSSVSFGQTIAQKDSVILEMCNTLKSNKHLSDTARFENMITTHLQPFLFKYPEDTQEDIWKNIYYRLQRTCREFRGILDRLSPPKGDWQELDEKPSSQLKKQACRNFLKTSGYYYLEGDGDKVAIEIKDGYWTDRFKDGTYSKLRFKWLNHCEFELEFVESNNEGRMNLSNPGDKYRYQLLDKKEGYYDVSSEIPNTSNFMKFKLYF